MTETTPVARVSMKPIALLKKYFGLKPGQDNAGFLREINQLSREERIELAALAGEQLNISVDLM